MKKIVKEMAAQIREGVSRLAARDIEVRPYSANELASILRMGNAILANQTASEQAIKATTNLNGEGFTGADAEICTDIVQKGNRYGLSQKQARLLVKKMVKYSRQLAEAKLAADAVKAAEQAASLGVAA